MNGNAVEVYDTFAEAWTLEVSRVLITAMTAELALGAANQFAGAGGSSMIGSRFNCRDRARRLSRTRPRTIAPASLSQWRTSRPAGKIC